MEIKYKLMSLADAIKSLNVDEPVMFDTETKGFYGKIRLAQFYQKHMNGTAIIVENPSPYELISYLTDLHIVAHNVHYDISTIQEQVGRLTWMPKKFDCTFLLSRLYFYDQAKFALDDVIKYTIGHDPYHNKKEMQKSDWNAVLLSEEQLIYAATDVICLQEVWDTVKGVLNEFSYKLDILCTKYCLDFQNNGMPILIDRLEDQYALNTYRIKEIGLPINCNSWQQVRPYIDSENSNDEGLARLSAQGSERAKAVRETRKLVKSNSFLTKYANTVENNSIFGKFKCSARSGRTTSSHQNLQQIPRKLKGIFGVPDGGSEVILYSDYAQIQLRGVCVITGDKTMEKLFREGKDLHNYVAEMIFGKVFTKTERQISKTANFGLLFGAGVFVFMSILLKQAGLCLKEQEAKKIKKKWVGLWKQISSWQQRGIKDWKNGRVWQTPLGRKYKAKMMTDQLAMQVQGFESEVAKLAMHYMIPKLKKLNTDIKLRNFIHDSYTFTCPNDKKLYTLANKIIADSMQEAWTEMCTSVEITDLPMPVNVLVGYNWGDIENGKYIAKYEQ